MLKRIRIANGQNVILIEIKRPEKFSRQSEFELSTQFKKVILSCQMFLDEKNLSTDNYIINYRNKKKIYLSKLDCSRLPCRPLQN